MKKSMFMNNVYRCQVVQRSLHSFLRFATRVQTPRLTVVVCERIWWSPVWTCGFSPGTSVRLTPLTINDRFSLISIPPTYFLLSCRTCLLIINIWVMFNAQFFYQNCWHCKVGRYPVNTLLIRNIVLALSFACILPPISRLHQPHPGHCSDSQHWVQIMLTSYPLFHVYIVVIVDIAMLADVDFKSLFLNLVYIVHIITTQCCPTSRRHCVYILPPLSC